MPRRPPARSTSRLGVRRLDLIADARSRASFRCTCGDAAAEPLGDRNRVDARDREFGRVEREPRVGVASSSAPRSSSVRSGERKSTCSARSTPTVRGDRVPAAPAASSCSGASGPVRHAAGSARTTRHVPPTSSRNRARIRALARMPAWSVGSSGERGGAGSSWFGSPGSQKKEETPSMPHEREEAREARRRAEVRGDLLRPAERLPAAACRRAARSRGSPRRKAS